MTTDTHKKTDNRTLITAVAVLVALASVTYALVSKQSAQTITSTTQTVSVSGQTYTPSDNNPVVLVVNGQDVTRDEIIENFHQSNSNLPADIDIQQIFPLLQDQYIIGALLEQAAVQNGITLDTPEVAAQLEQAKKQVIRAAYIKKIGDDALTDEDIRRAYEDIIGNTPVAEERHARHILVADEATAKDVIRQLNEGADFVTLAKTASIAPEGENGGDLGYFAKEEMVSPFSTAAFELEKGAISQTPVQTEFGWHVIKVEDIRTREKPSFEEVREQLGQQLRQSVIASKLEELRTGSEITVYSYTGEAIETIDADEAAVETPVVEQPVAEETQPVEAEEAATETPVTEQE